MSPFIKNRLEILYREASFSEVVEAIIKDGFSAEAFKVQYLSLDEKDPNKGLGKHYSKTLGVAIRGKSEFHSPETVYGITCFDNVWYFGLLVTNRMFWKEHRTRPFGYSSALGINMAKALLNIAGNGDVSKNLIDPCCGVGTVLLEGAFSGYNIIGWEINTKVAEKARGNLKHFNYGVEVITGNITTIAEAYDASIVDLPYGNFSAARAEDTQSIINEAGRISEKVVLVSAEDISHHITEAQLKITDSCQALKSKNGRFLRFIWVCVSV